MHHTIFQPNILSCFEEKVDFTSVAIFSSSIHLGFSTRLNFIILKPCSIITLHVKFENHGCSGNIAKVDINFQTITVTLFCYISFSSPYF